MRVMVMAGTSDAVGIIRKLAEHNDIDIIATTVTSLGRDIALSAGADEIIVGRLGAQEIAGILVANKIDVLVDATHPFAAEATLNAIKATDKSGIRYIRFERPSLKIQEDDLVFEVSSFKEASTIANEIMKRNPNGKMMHLAGVSTLYYMIENVMPVLIVPRILPMVSSLKKCLEMGIPSNNIISMQGTFSKEFNKAIMKEFHIQLVVTKESGETGGTPSKIEAAIELGIPIIIVKRPIIHEIEKMIVFNDIDDLMKNIER
jgi:precorrin-6A/cobalt-precorrin-6A reductase